MKQSAMMLGRLIDQLARVLAFLMILFTVPSFVMLMVIVFVGSFCHPLSLTEAINSHRFLFGLRYGRIWLLACGFTFVWLKWWLFPRKDECVLVPSGRFAAASKGFVAGLILSVLILSLLGLFWQTGFSSPIGSYTVCALTLLLSVGLMLFGLCFPLKEELRRRRWVDLALLCYVVMHFIVVPLVPRTGTFSSRIACDMVAGTWLTNRALPQSATDISLRVNAWSCFGGADWRCTVSESDFLTFAQENHYTLIDSAAGQDFDRDALKSVLPDGQAQPADFYLYYDSRWQHRGWVLLYDRTRHVLYGNYSSN